MQFIIHLRFPIFIMRHPIQVLIPYIDMEIAFLKYWLHAFVDVFVDAAKTVPDLVECQN